MTPAKTVRPMALAQGINFAGQGRKPRIDYDRANQYRVDAHGVDQQCTNAPIWRNWLLAAEAQKFIDAPQKGKIGRS